MTDLEQADRKVDRQQGVFSGALTKQCARPREAFSIAVMYARERARSVVTR